MPAMGGAGHWGTQVEAHGRQAPVPQPWGGVGLWAQCPQAAEPRVAQAGVHIWLKLHAPRMAPLPSRSWEPCSPSRGAQLRCLGAAAPTLEGLPGCRPLESPGRDPVMPCEALGGALAAQALPMRPQGSLLPGDMDRMGSSCPAASDSRLNPGPAALLQCQTACGQGLGEGGGTGCSSLRGPQQLGRGQVW